jgi:hypothetical protein
LTEKIRAPSQSAYKPNEQNVGRTINDVKQILITFLNIRSKLKAGYFVVSSEWKDYGTWQELKLSISPASNSVSFQMINKTHKLSHFFSVTKLYMFLVSSLLIIRSFLLYIQHW